jgi:hypothetical protein
MKTHTKNRIENLLPDPAETARSIHRQIEALSTPAPASHAPYTPLPEAVSLAKLLATDTSVDAMAAVLSGFLRSRERSHRDDKADLMVALRELMTGHSIAGQAMAEKAIARATGEKGGK